MWKSINSLGEKKGVLPCMKSQDLLRGGLNLTCNGFTSAVHIVRGVGLKDCSTQIRHMMHDCEYKPHFSCVFIRPNLLNAAAHVTGKPSHSLICNHCAAVISMHCCQIVSYLLICKRSFVDKAK